MFIAIQTKEISQERLQCLTTRVMRWAEPDIWLLDITAFISYWRGYASLLKTDCLGLWRSILQETFPEEDFVRKDSDLEGEGTLSLSFSYRAAISSNPWRAMLLLFLLKERRITGLIDASRSLAVSLFQDMPWPLWWDAVVRCAEHYETLNMKGFKMAVFSRQSERLRRGMERLGMTRPSDTRRLHYAGFQKRYGSFLADLWQMSWADTWSRSLYETPFPWISFAFKDKPEITRRLDDPMIEWDLLTVYIKEDLDRLSKKLHERERLLTLVWTLTLSDLTLLPVRVTFRSPHNLSQEGGIHKTTLLQMGYMFDSQVEKVLKGHLDAQYYDPPKTIIGWTMNVAETMFPPPLPTSLFEMLDERNLRHAELIQLENELPIPLYRYSLRDEWFPEHSYVRREASKKEDLKHSPEMLRSLYAAAAKRPLYIFTEPKSFVPPVVQKQRSSQETPEHTMNKWWLDPSLQDLERTYQTYTDMAGRAHWVFQNSSGVWYKHGVFG